MEDIVMSSQVPSEEELAAEERVIEDVDAELDARFTQSLDEEKLKKDIQGLALKEGTYITITPFNFKKYASEDGRAVASFFGRVVSVANSDIKGGVGYRISPDARNKIVDGQDTGKPDIATRLFLQAVSAFKVVYDRYPENTDEILSYLQEYSHKVRLMLTEDGKNIVVAISPVRE